MSDYPMLFEGEYMPRTGRFSCETLLIRDCPDEFRNPRNRWTKYARKAILNRSVDFVTWRYKPMSKQAQMRRVQCFTDLLRASWNIDPKNHKQVASRSAVLGWMLSEMLVKPPRYMPYYVEYEEH